MPQPRTYLAGSVPRYLRSTRLSYLPVSAVIGSWAIENPQDINQTFDVIMLPEPAFRRAQHWLADGLLGTPALQRGSLQAAYSIKDVRRITVPEDAADPYRVAAARLGRLFDLHIDRTVYEDAPSVAAAMRKPRDRNFRAAAPLLEAPFVAALAAKAAPPAKRPRQRSRIIF